MFHSPHHIEGYADLGFTRDEKDTYYAIVVSKYWRKSIIGFLGKHAIAV